MILYFVLTISIACSGDIFLLVNGQDEDSGNCTSEDFAFSGTFKISEDQNYATANLGESLPPILVCNTTCSEIPNKFQLIVPERGWVYDAQIITLGSPGNYMVACAAIFDEYTVNRTINATVVGVPVTSNDITITGLNMTSPTEGVAYVGSTLHCSAETIPRSNRFSWTLLNTGEDFALTYTVILYDEGVYSYRCTASNEIESIRYNASKTIRVSVLPKPIICKSSDLIFSGSLTLSADQSTGVAHPGDHLNCTTSCSEPPYKIIWRVLEKGRSYAPSLTIPSDCPNVYTCQCSTIYGIYPGYEVTKTIKVKVNGIVCGGNCLVRNTSMIFIAGAAAILIQTLDKFRRPIL